MKKLATILLIGTVTHLIAHARDVLIDGKKKPTTALDFVVASNVNIEGREVPSFVPVKSIGREAEDLHRLLRGARVEGGDGNGVNVLVHGVYAEEHFMVDGVKQTRQVVRIVRAETIGQDHEMVYDVKQRPRMRYGKASAVLGGNTTADATLTQVTVGDGQAALGELRLAMNSTKKVQAKSGRGIELVDTVEFINVKGWRNHAQSVAGVARGKPVLIEGHLRDDSFTRDDGTYVQRLCVEVSALYNRAPERHAPARTQARGRQTPARQTTPRQTPTRQTPGRQTPARQTPARPASSAPRFTAPGTRR